MGKSMNISWGLIVIMGMDGIFFLMDNGKIMNTIKLDRIGYIINILTNSMTNMGM